MRYCARNRFKLAEKEVCCLFSLAIIETGEEYDD